eukprot:3950356-Amphidinium_carterae.2
MENRSKSLADHHWRKTKQNPSTLRNKIVQPQPKGFKRVIQFERIQNLLLGSGGIKSFFLHPIAQVALRVELHVPRGCCDAFGSKEHPQPSRGEPCCDSRIFQIVSAESCMEPEQQPRTLATHAERFFEFTMRSYDTLCQLHLWGRHPAVSEQVSRAQGGRQQQPLLHVERMATTTSTRGLYILHGHES